MPYEPNPSTTDLDARAAGKCGWIKDNGEPCKNKAGHGTAHVGQGCCKKHNGGGGRPPTHGLYSQIKRPRIVELLAACDALDDPLDLTADLKMLRSLTVDWIERYDELVEAIIAWHESYQNPERTYKPTKVPDIADATALLDRIGAMVDRIEKRREKGALSMSRVKTILDQYAEQVLMATQAHVDDPDLQTKLLDDIEERWGRIELDTQPSGR